MKRLHIHVGVEKLEDSIQFYTTLFGAKPIKTKDDYAKWLLDEPSINFAISTHAAIGVEHLGIQVDEDDELAALRERLTKADMALFDEGETVCCYARSEKSWVTDPSGIPWESYKTMEDAQLFSNTLASEEAACCVPDAHGKTTATEPTESGAESRC